MKYTAIFLAMAALLLLAGVALAKGSTSAPLSTGYDLLWHVIGGGGRHSQATPYALDGTIGQAVVETVSSDGYTLCSGFWCGVGAAVVEHKIYLPMVMKNYQ